MGLPRTGAYHGGMKTRPGFTLVELTLVLSLSALLLMMAAAPFQYARDVLSARAAAWRCGARHRAAHGPDPRAHEYAGA